LGRPAQLCGLSVTSPTPSSPCASRLPAPSSDGCRDARGAGAVTTTIQHEGDVLPRSSGKHWRRFVVAWARGPREAKKTWIAGVVASRFVLGDRNPWRCRLTHGGQATWALGDVTSHAGLRRHGPVVMSLHPRVPGDRGTWCCRLTYGSRATGTFGAVASPTSPRRQGPSVLSLHPRVPGDRDPRCCRFTQGFQATVALGAVASPTGPRRQGSLVLSLHPRVLGDKDTWCCRFTHGSHHSSLARPSTTGGRPRPTGARPAPSAASRDRRAVARPRWAAGRPRPAEKAHRAQRPKAS
jgi:hypothetical protein